MRQIEIISVLTIIIIVVIKGANNQQITRSEIIERAKFWVNNRVSYSQTNFRNDPTGQSYRTDSSGFVSMAWRLPTSLHTSTLPQVSIQINKDQLSTGDLILRVPQNRLYGRAVIFDKWIDNSRNSYWGYELIPPSATYRQISYPYFSPGNWNSYRYRNVQNSNNNNNNGTGTGFTGYNPWQCYCTTGNGNGLYCGHQLSNSCAPNKLYRCRIKNGIAFITLRACWKGCQSSGDGQSHCQ